MSAVALDIGIEAALPTSLPETSDESAVPDERIALETLQETCDLLAHDGAQLVELIPLAAHLSPDEAALLAGCIGHLTPEATEAAVRWVVRALIEERGPGREAVARLRAALAINSLGPWMSDAGRQDLLGSLAASDCPNADAALEAARNAARRVLMLGAGTRVVPLADAPLLDRRTRARIARGQTRAFLCVVEDDLAGTDALCEVAPSSSRTEQAILEAAVLGDTTALATRCWGLWARARGRRLFRACLWQIASVGTLVLTANALGIIGLVGWAAGFAIYQVADGALLLASAAEWFTVLGGAAVLVEAALVAAAGAIVSIVLATTSVIVSRVWAPLLRPESVEGPSAPGPAGPGRPLAWLAEAVALPAMAVSSLLSGGSVGLMAIAIVAMEWHALDGWLAAIVLALTVVVGLVLTFAIGVLSFAVVKTRIARLARRISGAETGG